MIMHSAKSKLTQYGYYHLWVNHSERYAHEKFTFIHTSGIERIWRSLKSMFPPLKYVHKPSVVNEFAHAFTLRKIIRKEFAHEFFLRTIHFYFKANYKKFLKLRKYNNHYAPNAARIHETIELLEANPLMRTKDDLN